MEKYHVSVVVPVLNEQEIISETVEIFLRDLSNVCGEYELIIVNDGSVDNTQAILEELVVIYPERLKIVKNSKNLGSGRSLINGFKNARFPLVATNFADRPFDLKEMEYILPLFDKETDFVVVSRFDRSANTIYRKLTSLVNYYLIRLLFRVRVGDFQFVQIYKKEVLDNINVEANHTFVPPEIIIKALKKRYRMAEYKAKFYPRNKGKAKCGHPRVIFTTLYDIFRLWFKIK